MASFVVELLFTNILLQETIDLCVQKLFENKNYIDGLSKDSFCEMFTVAITESFILFDNEYYRSSIVVGGLNTLSLFKNRKTTK